MRVWCHIFLLVLLVLLGAHPIGGEDSAFSKVEIDGDKLDVGHPSVGLFSSLAQEKLVLQLSDGGEPLVWPAHVKRNLTWCLDSSVVFPSGSMGTSRRAVRWAMEMATLQWENAADVNFIFVQDCSGAWFSVKVGHLDGAAAIAPVMSMLHDYALYLRPDEGAVPWNVYFPSTGQVRQVKETTRRLKATVIIDESDISFPDLVDLLEHEVGHILGFRHEHILASSDLADCNMEQPTNVHMVAPPGGWGPLEEIMSGDSTLDDGVMDVDPHTNPEYEGDDVTPIDRASVMAYGWCGGHRVAHSGLSKRDKLSAQFVYGPPKSDLAPVIKSSSIPVNGHETLSDVHRFTAAQGSFFNLRMDVELFQGPRLWKSTSPRFPTPAMKCFVQQTGPKLFCEFWGLKPRVNEYYADLDRACEDAKFSQTIFFRIIKEYSARWPNMLSELCECASGEGFVESLEDVEDMEGDPELNDPDVLPTCACSVFETKLLVRDGMGWESDNRMALVGCGHQVRAVKLPYIWKSLPMRKNKVTIDVLNAFAPAQPNRTDAELSASITVGRSSMSQVPARMNVTLLTTAIEHRRAEVKYVPPWGGRAIWGGWGVGDAVVAQWIQFAESEIVSVLNLAGNKITSFPPQNVSSKWLSTIVTADLRGNEITTLRTSLLNAPLRDLTLRDNKLSEIPPWISEFKGLRYLDVTENNLEALPFDLLQIESLQILYASHNSISSAFVPPSRPNGSAPEHGEVKSDIFDLRISNNKLSSFPEKLCELKNLNILHLRQNAMDSIPACIGTRFMRDLAMSGNRLKTFPSISCPSLVTLDLAINNISTIADDVFAKLPMLKTLSLAGNRLEGLPTSIGDLKSLARFEASQNRISELPSTFKKLHSLESLDLRGNELISIEEIAEIRSLRALFLDYNVIRSIPQEMAKISLKSLNLGHNNISSLPSMGSDELAAALRSIDLSNNALSELGESFSLLAGLRMIDVRGNRIARVDASLSALRDLKQLVLDDNQIDSIPQSLCELRNLTTLSVENNFLTRFPQCNNTDRSVAYVNVNGNAIERNPSFSSWATIEELHMTRHAMSGMKLRHDISNSVSKEAKKLSVIDFGYARQRVSEFTFPKILHWMPELKVLKARKGMIMSLGRTFHVVKNTVEAPKTRSNGKVFAKENPFLNMLQTGMTIPRSVFYYDEAFSVASRNRGGYQPSMAAIAVARYLSKHADEFPRREKKLRKGLLRCFNERPGFKYVLRLSPSLRRSKLASGHPLQYLDLRDNLLHMQLHWNLVHGGTQTVRSTYEMQVFPTLEVALFERSGLSSPLNVNYEDRHAVLQLQYAEALKSGKLTMTGILGPEPVAWAMMQRNLNYLDISANRATHLPTPTNFSEVQVLRASHNELHEVPEWVFTLGKLEKLLLNFNHITNLDLPRGTGDAELLPRAKYIDVSYNRVTTIPSWIFELPNLKRLILTGNVISKISDFKPRVSQLRHLSLDWNLLASLPPAFALLQNLLRLDVSANSFKALPPVLGQMPNLQSLRAERNKMTSGGDVLRNLTSLKVLMLSGNPIGDFPTHLPAPLETLHLDEIEVDASALNITTIKSLFCSNCGLRDASFVSNMPDLSRLHIQSNHLTSIPPPHPLAPCREIVASNNELEEIHFAWTNCYHARFSDNKIRAIPYVGKARWLVAGNNFITKLPLGVGHGDLSLSLWGNNITEISSIASQLYLLNVENNNIRSPLIPYATQTNTLLQSNPIRPLPPSVPFAYNLSRFCKLDCRSDALYACDETSYDCILPRRALLDYVKAPTPFFYQRSLLLEISVKVLPPSSMWRISDDASAMEELRLPNMTIFYQTLGGSTKTTSVLYTINNVPAIMDIFSNDNCVNRKSKSFYQQSLGWHVWRLNLERRNVFARCMGNNMTYDSPLFNALHFNLSDWGDKVMFNGVELIRLPVLVPERLDLSPASKSFQGEDAWSKAKFVTVGEALFTPTFPMKIVRMILDSHPESTFGGNKVVLQFRVFEEGGYYTQVASTMSLMRNFLYAATKVPCEGDDLYS